MDLAKDTGEDMGEDNTGEVVTIFTSASEEEEQTVSAVMSEYEKQRVTNIERNNEELRARGLQVEQIQMPSSAQVDSDSDSDEEYQQQSSLSSSSSDEALHRRRRSRPRKVKSKAQESKAPKSKTNRKRKRKRKDGETSDDDDEDDEDAVKDPRIVDWTKEGVVIGADVVLGETVLSAEKKAGVPSVSDQRLFFLMDETMVEPDNLKARAALLGLNVHKCVKATDAHGNKYIKKIFFYVAGNKKPKNEINKIRFAKRKSGLYTLSSTMKPPELLQWWAGILPPQSGKVKEVVKRQRMRYTPAAVRTVITMLTGDSRTHSTYRQIAARLNDEHAKSAYRVNEQFRDYNTRDVRRLVDMLFPKVCKHVGEVGV